MSNVYLQEDRDRSNSTITSDSNHVSVAPMPTAMEEDYVKRTMLISQLQDLFPDLGDGFLEACLKAFNDDPEAVTMRLLEENLPTDLATMDRSTVRWVSFFLFFFVCLWLCVLSIILTYVYYE
jgi:hypothetical protein